MPSCVKGFSCFSCSRNARITVMGWGDGGATASLRARQPSPRGIGVWRKRLRRVVVVHLGEDMFIARVAFMLIALNLAVTAALDASAASINFSGTVEGSSISIDASPALPCPPCYYPYLELNNGNFTATAVYGFNSLTGVSPSNIALTVGRLAAFAFSIDPIGCTYPNCHTLTQSYEAFSSASQINLLLDG